MKKPDVAKVTFKAKNSVYGLAVSPDSKLIGSVSCDRNMQIWDAATGAQLYKTYTGYTWMELITFSPAGDIVACGYGPISLYSTRTGKLLKKLSGLENYRDKLERIVFSSDGRYIATFTRFVKRNVLVVWEVNTGKILWKTFMLEGKSIPRFHSVEFTTGNLLIAVDWDGLFIVDFKKGGITFQKEIDTGNGMYRYIKPVGKYVVCVFDFCRLEIYDCKAFKLVKKLQMKDEISAMDVSKDGKIAMITGDDDKIVVRDIKDLSVIKTINDPFGDMIKTLAIAPNGKFVVACSDNYIKRFDL